MHPQELKGYLDHIYDKFVQLCEENSKLRRENKHLHEEISRINSFVPVSSNQTKEHIPSKMIKLGSDWHIEGDKLENIFLIKKLRFTAPICNAKISPNGLVAFTCNRRIFLFKDDKFYLVEEQIRPFDPSAMFKDLKENFRCIFEFVGESLVIFYKNSIIKYTDLEKDWMVPMPGVYHIQAYDDLIYIGTRDMRIHVLKESENVGGYSHKEPFKYFTVCAENIIGYNDYRIVVLGKNGVLNEGGRILAMDSNQGTLYYGGESATLKVCTIGQNLDILDTLMLKKVILAIKSWRNYLLISTQDKTLSIWNLTTRKSQRIISMDNVIDISANNNHIVCVDNNGNLRIWSTLEEEKL